MSLTSS